MKGKVYLVGAGPGDPGLLTLKAAAVLRRADVIVYDYLANPEHLRHAKDDCKIVSAGKGLRHKRLDQDHINRIIVDSAKKGRTVVRLKGGDPYLFGRGGEEALFLKKHGIPFEVVPGVTSATACAAYAGIPLTHREHNASVTFLTGHRAEDGELDSIDWRNLVERNGTIAIYMGFYNLATIARKLVSHGMPATTPVAVVEWGTLPRQRSETGTLADIAGRVTAAKFAPPCMIYVGEVVSLSRDLAWFEHLPLFGKRIVQTRASKYCDPLGRKLSALGADVRSFPVIRIEAAPAKPIDAAIRSLNRFDWIVFTSSEGVHAFFDRVDALKLDARALGAARVASVGPSTTQALYGQGVRADLEPKRYETRAVVEEFKKRSKSLKGKRVLLVRPDIAPPELDRGLVSLDAAITRVIAYRTRLEKHPAAEVRKLCEEGADYVTFTSASTVKNFVAILGRAGARRLFARARAASIGPVTSKELRRFGIRPACEAREYTFKGLAAAISADAAKRKKRKA